MDERSQADGWTKVPLPRRTESHPVSFDLGLKSRTATQHDFVLHLSIHLQHYSISNVECRAWLVTRPSWTSSRRSGWAGSSRPSSWVSEAGMLLAHASRGEATCTPSPPLPPRSSSLPLLSLSTRLRLVDQALLRHQALFSHQGWRACRCRTSPLPSLPTGASTAVGHQLTNTRGS